MFKFERFFWQFFGARLSTKLPIRRKLFNNSSCSGDLNFYAPFHCHLKFPFPCNIVLLSSSQWPRSIEQFLLLLFLLYIYICIYFLFFATSLRWADPTPVSLEKVAKKKKALWTWKMEEESQKGRPINFMTKLRPFHTFWLHSEIPNLNIKYLQLWVTAA